MNASQQRRMWAVIGGLIFFTLVIVGRLFAFQIVQGKGLARKGEGNRSVRVVALPDRGLIYDRNGTILAANGTDYQVSASPNQMSNKEEVATALAPLLEQKRQDILDKLEGGEPYVSLAWRVSPEVADAIRALPYDGVALEPLPRRIYPQGNLLSHALGYVDLEGVGSSGLEGYYQSELAGEAAIANVNVSPLTQQPEVIAREGADLILTIDRTVQHVVEKHLRQALADTGARSGTIIVMDPRTGAILAMASLPDFDPFRYNEYYVRDEGELLLNPAVSLQYEPGSVMKLVTMAAALDSGTVAPNSTYYDRGSIEVGGHVITNWDFSGPGETTMTTLMVRSLNVGAATLATWMGPDVFYHYVVQFGFGRELGVDLSTESPGQLALPLDGDWSEANLGTNAFGQAIGVTPLQMITAAAALANGGKMMQPYLVQEINGPDQVLTHQPEVLGQPVSPETAHTVTAMAVQVVNQGVVLAQVDGYTVAGKSGTAQIPEAGIYNPTDIIGSFIGWLPADAPEIIVLVKLDRPRSAPWGSQTAAPVFSKLVNELVVLLDIPPDQIRLQPEVSSARSGN